MTTDTRAPTDELVGPPLALDALIQIALVVEDLDAALDAWCELLGVARPDVRTTDATPDPSEEYRGATAAYGLRFAVVECPARGFVVELHEPDRNPSTFREFLDAHGQGVHHLGFAVGEARDAVVGSLRAGGYDVRTVGTYPGGSWTVVDTEDRLGVNLNIKPRA